MEISEKKFVLFWAAISAIFLKLAFDSIDNTELSNSASPLVIFLFKHSSAIFTCYSSNHAFRRSRMNKPVGPYLLFFSNGVMILVILTGGSMAHCYLPIYAVASQYNLFIVASNDGRFSSKWKLVLYLWYIMSTAFVIVPAFGPTNFKAHAKTLTMIAVTIQNIVSIIISNDGRFRSKWELLAYAFYIIASSFAIVSLPAGKGYANTITMFCGPLSLPSFLFQVNEWDEAQPLPTTDLLHYPNLILTILDRDINYKIKKSAEFAVGLVGTILFQNFFRLNSFKQVMGFLYIAVAWLANLTTLSASHDLGVFNFLLGNAIVGCSVSEFGLGGKTWIAYAASVFLYCLKLKLQSLSFVDIGGGNRKVVLW